MTGPFRRSLLLFVLGLVAGSLCFGELVGAEQQRLADGLYARGLYDLALVEYQKLLSGEEAAGPKDLLLYRAGECASRIGNSEQAVAYFKEAIRVGGQGVAAQRSRYRLADAAYRNGELEEAEHLLRRLVAGEVDVSLEVPVRFTLARILESRKQTAEALEIYEKLLKDYPEDSLSAYAALRVASLSNVGLEQKRRYYQQALAHPPSRDFEVEALWGLANLERSAKNFPEAADTFWKLWSTFPDSSRVRGGMIHLAWAQLQAGEFKRAQALSKQTSDARKASDADTWYYLDALCYKNLGEEKSAVSSFETLLEKFPASRFRSQAVIEVSGAYVEKGEYPKVLAYAEDLQQIPGREVEGLWLLAESARGAGENRQALQTYTRIAHQFPKDERAPDALYFKAILLLKTAEPEVTATALRDFQKRYPEDPRSLKALEQAGDLLVKSGELTQGLRAWMEVLEADQDFYPELEFKVAMLEIRLEKREDARRRLEEYLAQDVEITQRANGNYWLGVLLDRQGDSSAAQAALQAALDADIKAEWRTAARMRLGQSYTRNGESKKALEVFLPVFGTVEEDELSDALLLWLLPEAVSNASKDAQGKIAVAMTKEFRKAATRELGYYALAEVEELRGNLDEAMRAWEKGLAFRSGTFEAAEAHLKFADLLLANKKFAESFRHYSEATKLASSLEDGKLEALGIMGSAKVRMAEENWPDAARYFMSVAVLFEDPELTPQALRLAVEAFRKAGQPDNADAAMKEFKTRYPERPIETP